MMMTNDNELKLQGWMETKKSFKIFFFCKLYLLSKRHTDCFSKVVIPNFDFCNEDMNDRYQISLTTFLEN